MHIRKTQYRLHEVSLNCRLITDKHTKVMGLAWLYPWVGGIHTSKLTKVLQHIKFPNWAVIMKNFLTLPAFLNLIKSKASATHFESPAALFQHVQHISYSLQLWSQKQISTYHNSFRVSSKWILQETGQFGVSVWDVGTFAINECWDHVTKGRQGQVDFSSLLESLTSGSCLRLSLWTLEYTKYQ